MNKKERTVKKSEFNNYEGVKRIPNTAMIQQRDFQQRGLNLQKTIKVGNK